MVRGVGSHHLDPRSARVNDENDDPGLDVTDDEVSNDSAPVIDAPVVATAQSPTTV